MSDETVIERLENARAYLQLSGEAMRQKYGADNDDAIALLGAVRYVQNIIERERNNSK